MLSIFTIFFFVLGLIIGSFLNVVIFRFNTERSFGGRSACLACARELPWYELIPVVSFLGLGGRCRGCRTKISIIYPVVELLAGTIFAALFLEFQDILFADVFAFALTYAYYTFMFSLLLVIAVYDLRHKIIPNKLVWLFAALAFLGLFYSGVPTLSEFLAGLLVALPFFLFWLFSGGRWMGLGDAKLALGLGWFLGLSISLSAVAIAFWSGALAGLALLVFFRFREMRKFGLKSEIPFAPFLALGTFLAFIFDLNLFAIPF